MNSIDFHSRLTYFRKFVFSNLIFFQVQADKNTNSIGTCSLLVLSPNKKIKLFAYAVTA